MIRIRTSIAVAFLTTIAFVVLALVYAPVVPKASLMAARMLVVKSQIMRFAYRYGRLPTDLVEVKAYLRKTDTKFGCKGIEMEKLGSGRIALRSDGFESVFCAVDRRNGNKPVWSSIEVPWTVAPHQVSADRP